MLLANSTNSGYIYKQKDSTIVSPAPCRAAVPQERFFEQMGLFPSSKDFKAGPGVEKDAPRKTGIGRFFELVGRDLNGMFLANLLTCIGFLPVICLVCTSVFS